MSKTTMDINLKQIEREILEAQFKVEGKGAPLVKPDSPFLPGTKIQFAWDSTSLGYLKQCPRLYQYTMIEGWSSKDESIHLRFGIEFHRAHENYHHSRALGISHNESVHDVVRELLYSIEDWDPDITTKAGKYKNRQSLVRTVILYLDHYENDAAKTYIKSDGKPAVELSFRFELDWNVPGWDQPYLLCGHLDRVVNFNDELFIADPKTTTTILSDYYFKQYEPNNQMTCYTIASKVILEAPIKGVIIDGIQIMMDDARFVRRFTYRTPDQLEEWLGDLRYWFTLAEQFAKANYWPQNDTACDKFGGCRFREICSKSPQVRKQFLKANFKQLPEEERWNPLKPR